MRAFRPHCPDDVVPLPLFGSLSPEEQQRVIRFNEPGRRMVVFWYVGRMAHSLARPLDLITQIYMVPPVSRMRVGSTPPES